MSKKIRGCSTSDALQTSVSVKNASPHFSAILRVILDTSCRSTTSCQHHSLARCGPGNLHHSLNLTGDIQKIEYRADRKLRCLHVSGPNSTSHKIKNSSLIATLGLTYHSYDNCHSYDSQRSRYSRYSLVDRHDGKARRSKEKHANCTNERSTMEDSLVIVFKLIKSALGAGDECVVR
jgi:hypothetical protein